MKKVTVIVPVYNSEKYLERCFDTLVAQTLDDIEIIAVDDGSTDGSLALLERYQAAFPDKITVLVKENGGQATARNMALRAATGKYIGCVDSDDSVEPEMFERLYSEAESSGADMIACESVTMTEHGPELMPFDDYTDPREMYIDAWVSPCTKLVKKEVYDAGKVIFPEGYIYEDTAWFADLIPYIKSVVTIHEPFYHRYINENSTMTIAQGKRTASIFPVMNNMVEFYRERGVYDEYRDELEFFYVRILLLSSLMRIALIRDKKLRNEYIKRTFAEINAHFPDYRRNKYLGSKRLSRFKRAFMKHATVTRAKAVALVFRMKNGKK